MKPSNNKYNITTITIHWLSTVLILILFPMGSYMSGLDTTEKLGLVQTHALLNKCISTDYCKNLLLFYEEKTKRHTNRIAYQQQVDYLDSQYLLHFTFCHKHKRNCYYA